MKKSNSKKKNLRRGERLWRVPYKNKRDVVVGVFTSIFDSFFSHYAKGMFFFFFSLFLIFLGE